MRSEYVQQVNRTHFITRQDCCNIVRNLSNHQHENDAISVDRIVKELQQESPSPVIFYKPQRCELPRSQLGADTFLLLMTQFQADIYAHFAEKIVCFDSTHGTNEYNFKLGTLLVDEFRNDI